MQVYPYNFGDPEKPKRTQKEVLDILDKISKGDAESDACMH